MIGDLSNTDKKGEDDYSVEDIVDDSDEEVRIVN